jgi:lipopolysaccharide/colanic/teichoic acid biosynthesis glycosyltransferase
MSNGSFYSFYNIARDGENKGNSDSSPMVLVPKKLVSPGLLFFKKNIDFIGAVIGSIVLIPIILALSIIIKITSKGPVLYAHERIGQFGKPFLIYKFRSMYINAEDHGPKLSSKSDPRITPIGRFMRKWHLDEIPNFINVFKGEMSLVGPRPERQFYIDQIIKISPEYIHLLQIKPGVTSLGEVEYGYAENVDQMIIRMNYDLQYLHNISVLKDLLILARSINVVLKGKGV